MSSSSASSLPVVQIYTDGACSGNPGPGGWAYILRHPESGRESSDSGAEPQTTNNRMELMGPIEGLRSLVTRRTAEIYSDSAYVVNCFRDKWYEAWRKNGWRNKQKKLIDNRDLWEELLAQVERHDVTWHKVAGHSGHPLNDRADALARTAIPKR